MTTENYRSALDAAVKEYETLEPSGRRSIGLAHLAQTIGTVATARSHTNGTGSD
jgi:hypothetical protein